MMDVHKFIHNFVSEHCKLIDEEFKADCAQNANHDIVNNASYLERSGLMIKSSCIVSQTTEYGKQTIEFSLETSGKSKSRFAITAGDTVNVFVIEKEGKRLLALGVINNVYEESLCVCVDSVSPVAWDQYEDSAFCIVKTASQVTTQRMKSALRNIRSLESRRSGVMVDILFGNAELERVPLHPKILNSSGKINFINDNLHDGQREAVEFALRQKNLAIIHGPPGTGKTTALVEIILQLVISGNKILLCAPSNIAVDTILEKLLVFKARVVRIGHTARMLDSIKDYSLSAALSNGSEAEILLDVKREIAEKEHMIRKTRGTFQRCSIKSEIKELKKELQFRRRQIQRDALLHVDIVLATLTTAHKEGFLQDVPEEHFDVVVIDECSQSLEAACWIAIPRAPKLILAGDHHQLQATIRCKESEQVLGLSLMERAIQKLGDSCYYFLTHQFRMNCDIMNWVSHVMYNGKLEADESVAKHLLKDLPGVKETQETATSLLFINTAGFDLHETEPDERGSIANEGEACIVVEVVKKLVDAGVDCQSVAVITPYSQQVFSIEQKLTDLSDIEVRTVDGFQGREKEAIVLSFVRSNINRDIGFVTDKRRLNVAVSRARRLLVVIADSYTVGSDKHIGSLLNHMEENGVVQFAQDYMEALDNITLPKSLTTNRNKKMPSQNLKTRSRKKALSPPEKSSPSSESNLGPSSEKKQEVMKWVEKLKSVFADVHVNTYKLPASLTPFERSLVHEAAGMLQFSHFSTDSGGKRQIIVCRKSGKRESSNSEGTGILNNINNVGDAVNKVEGEHQVSNVEDAGNKVEGEHQKTDSRIKKINQKKKKDSVAVSESLNNNKLLGNSSNTTRPMYFIDNSVSSNTEVAGASGNVERKTEDFDKVAAEFAKLNTKCTVPSCKVSCKLMWQVCMFCRKQFCYNHAQAEVHGCGEAAKSAAKHSFRHPEPKPMNERDRKAARAKLKMKLSQMADSRKPQTKKN